MFRTLASTALRRRIIVFGGALLAGIATCSLVNAAGAQPLTEYYSMEGGFAAGFPRKPDYTTEQTAGDTTLHQYLVNLGGIAYLVAYSDDPAGDSGDPQSSLQQMQDVVVSGKTLLRQEASSYGPYPGRAFDYRDSAGVTIRQRIYLVRKHFYQIIFAGSDSAADAASAERFFSSFKLF